MKSKRILAIVAGVMVSGAVLGVAAATEHEATDVYGGGDDDAVLVEYDEESGTLTLAIRGEDGEFPDCGAEGEGDGDAEDAELPEGCFVVMVDGDADDLNHGKFVSAVAKALHPSLLPDGVKKGHIMRVVAKSKLGKDAGATDDTEADGDGADAGTEDDAKADKAAAKAERKAERDAAKAERKAERDAAKAERKAARDAAKAERNAARADRKANKRTGPPDHAKANGTRHKG